MKLFRTKYQKVTAAVGVVAGVTSYLYYYYNNNGKVFASWTTAYEPSQCGKWDDNWDRRNPKYLVHPKTLSVKDTNQTDDEKMSPKAMRHIILIRHGQYNLDGPTDMERTLTKLGRMQAEYTGKRLKELGLPFTQMVKSTMSRAQETGSIIEKSLQDIEIKHCDLIREGAPIPPEPPIGHWRQNYSFFVDGARIEAGFRKYFHRADPEQTDDDYLLLVCHANVIRYFVCRALQFPAEAWLRLSLNHGSITWLSITPSGRVVLRCLGDTGHMPPEAITSH